MSTNNTTNLHPEDWSVQDLMSYMHYEMNWSVAAIAALTKEKMVEHVLRDEIDKE